MTTYFDEGDIDGMLADMGVPVTFGAYSALALVDSADELLLAGGGLPGVIGTKIVITFKTSALPGLAVGSAITIDGASYTVRSRASQGDGAVTQAFCEAA